MSYEIETLESAITIPEPDPYFFLPVKVINMLKWINELSKKHPVNVLVTGRQGCGKSSLVRQFAARNKRPLATFQVGMLSEPGQLFGELRLKGGETYYKKFLFPEAIQTPNCVIHLEEINRPENPKALNMLLSILSEDRQAWIDEIGLVKVAKGVVFFATMNEGEEFIGTEMLDAALRDRFYTIALDYPPPEVEAKILHLKTGIDEAEALTIVNVANRLRDHPKEPIQISVRHTIMIAELVSVGASIPDAFMFSLSLSKDTLESVLLSLHVEEGLTGKITSEEYAQY